MSGNMQRKPFNKNFQKGQPFNRQNGKKSRGKKGGNRFLSNAKGFAKKGNFGRGTTIEAEQFTYFIGILDVLNKPSNSTEDRVTMASNVLEQTEGNEIHLASNQIVSKVLEALIGFSEPKHLERLFEVFGENFRPICADVFASYVLQKMIEIAFIRAVGESKVGDEDEEEENEEVDEEKDGAALPKKAKEDLLTDLKYNLRTEFAEDHRTKCSEFLVRVSKFLLNNLEEFVWNTCGSHLIRLCILSLSGVHIPKQPYVRGKPTGQKKGLTQQIQTTFEVPAEWTELMKEFPSRLEMWPQFPDFPYKEQSSALIGVICVALSHADKSNLKSFVKKLLADAFVNVVVPENKRKEKTPFTAEDVEKNGKKEGSDDENDVKEEEGSDDEEEKPAKKSEEEEKQPEAEKDDQPSVFKTESSVRLLETVLSVVGPKLIAEIYTTLFAGRVVELAKDRHTNYTVQKLLNNISEKTLFETIFEELIGHFEKFLEIGNPGVVSAISGACLRLNTKQAAFITALQSAVHCTTGHGADRPKSFFPCLLKMKPAEVLPYDKASYVLLYGSLIIQDILQFNKPIFLVNCILETPAKELSDALQFPNGSYIADAFLKSKFIGEKSREKFVKLFEDYYMPLALGRCGSRVLQQLFEAANEGQKMRIAKELTAKENKLKGTLFGRIIYNVLRLETFKLSPDQWKASWTAKSNKDEVLLSKKTKKRAAS